MIAERPWIRRNLLFTAQGQRPWMQTHAAVPFAERLEGSLYRVYFSTRDAQGRSHVASAVVDIERPGQVLELSEAPLLAPGELGAFDDSGVMLSWICGGPETRRRWYYIGWNLGVTVPFRNSIGLAWESDGCVERAYRGPIVDRTRDEPHFTASCCVLEEPGLWRIYYLACTGWDEQDGAPPRHRYHIRYADSVDGINWHREGRVAIDFAEAGEYAISRPTIIREARGYFMWFSTRGTHYRIMHAYSSNGLDWVRSGKPSLDASGEGWDSDMACYPHVVVHDDRQLLFYNGNGYGITGFGFAERSLPTDMTDYT